MSNEPMFPILNDPIIRAIPWAAIAPYEAQAQKNHSQSLRGLASRGGLSVIEAVRIMRGFGWQAGEKFTPAGIADYRTALMADLAKFEKSRALTITQPEPTRGQSDAEL